MRHLLILNDPPYGTERSFNGLRMAHALAKHDPEGEVTVFLMADAVLCAKAGQKTPEGFYNVERMLGRVLSAKGRVLMCGTCMDARGLAIDDMCVFRELWALISRDLGRAFRAIMGSHFADAGRLADGFMESGLIGSVKRFRDIGPASEAFS